MDKHTNTTLDEGACILKPRGGSYYPECVRCGWKSSVGWSSLEIARRNCEHVCPWPPDATQPEHDGSMTTKATAREVFDAAMTKVSPRPKCKTCGFEIRNGVHQGEMCRAAAERTKLRRAVDEAFDEYIGMWQVSPVPHAEAVFNVLSDLQDQIERSVSRER
jgi:hypothetical protein